MSDSSMTLNICIKQDFVIQVLNCVLIEQQALPHPKSMISIPNFIVAQSNKFTIQNEIENSSSRAGNLKTGSNNLHEGKKGPGLGLGLGVNGGFIDGNHQNRPVLHVRKDFDKVFFSKKVAGIVDEAELDKVILQQDDAIYANLQQDDANIQEDDANIQQDDANLQQDDRGNPNPNPANLQEKNCINNDFIDGDVCNDGDRCIDGDDVCVVKDDFVKDDLRQIQNEIIFYQTNQNEFLSIFDNDSLFHLLLVKNQNLDDLDTIGTSLDTIGTSTSGKEDSKKLLFSSQYDLYSLDKNIISLSLEWMDHYTSYIANHTISKPANPISSSIGSLKSIKLKIEYHIENSDCLLKKQMIDLHDSSEIEAQLLWVIKLASFSSPAQLDSTVSEKSARLFLDSWFQKREASLDFVEDLLWNVFYQSSDKNIGFLHIPRIVFQYVSEKMETAELVPVFERTNKSLFGKEIKEWIIQSSLSGGKVLEKSLQTVFKKFTDHHHEILFNMAICSLQSKLYQILVYHSSKSISSADLSTLLKDFFEQSQQEQLQILWKLFHISNLQSLVSDYVLGIPQQSLNSLLVPFLNNLQKKDILQSSSTIYLETELPKFDTASLQVVKGICDRLVPDYWMVTFQHSSPSSPSSLSSSSIHNNQDAEREFVFLIRSENDEEDSSENDEEGFSSSHDPNSVKYKQWIARMTRIKRMTQITR